MTRYIAAVSALATMTGRFPVEADTPQEAAELARKLLDNDTINVDRDYEFVDGGRPAPGSEAIDAIWDGDFKEELYTVPPPNGEREAIVLATLHNIATEGTPEEKARAALAHLGAARDLLKDIGASRRLLDKIRLAISSAKGAVRHAYHRSAAG